MILGLTFAQFTTLHVLISLIAIATGLVAVPAYARGQRTPTMTTVFLATTFATSATGFLFPITAMTPALLFGIISTVVLLIAYVALYSLHRRGRARIVYVVSATFALYLNIFVLIVQAFLKVEVLNTLAPNGNEPPFLVAQGVLLAAMLALGWKAVKNHPGR